jgi:hypothetical protein
MAVPTTTRTTGVRLCKSPASLLACALATVTAYPCSAAFTGFSVQNLGVVGGRAVYQVYANFSDPNNVLLNCLNHQVQWGSMNALHNDLGGGTWNPVLTLMPEQVSNDSFVTISGVAGVASSTNLDPSFGLGTGSAIADGAGWYNSNPGNSIVVGASLRIMVMQIARAPGDTSMWQGYLEVGYKDSLSSAQPIFGGGLYSPAPGALALLLGVTPLRARRRSCE